ncbi:hypothetical protein [Singulisphaera sp. PoT]|uniref:hypothetical protein n=1 Tax=Singulisphaera sp. PoT TaxID=3411797 RepID=UPI003BF57066
MMLPIPSSSENQADLPIRNYVIVFLRVALGISLLNEGIVESMMLKMAGGPASIHSMLPHLEIMLGGALIFGIFTTMASLASSIFLLIKPLVVSGIMLTGGNLLAGPFGMQAYLEKGSSTNILLTAAVLWFSSPGRNPYSLDQLLFSKRRQAQPTPEPEVVTKPPDWDELPTAPKPGERTARFLASRDE